ncbi:fucose-1-phosphate guanylyltransferase-like [Penaeus japonicus]|uniref:fucose-1-phosphate guanylyltransferase-like n=1 Tax=Penaeus japonicus TaxID=27405 RepID=UPI001C70B151|nr:fucose-1-phosphate guanylyltransferase-like [Penaeus japonicus]XP_042867303.1 fucose-1-phosphate guanylyltransferase-like [Penaeus japonicus]
MADEIGNSMAEIFKSYNNLRRNNNAGVTKERPQYWDVIILTTFDAAQRECFEQQIALKRQNGHFPDVPIHVIADPVGQKLGVGGSTLHVLAEMTKVYGNDLHRKKLLIIHSGGSSQRLPSYSVIGKIFAPVPCQELIVGAAIPQMLDLKLAMYLPFCQLLEPGVFVTCADDIETYCLDAEKLDRKALETADVVALAHPSDIQTGEGHGVYVFEDQDLGDLAGGGSALVRQCAEVLQKPSEGVMRAKGAVVTKEDNGSVREQVWSDSVFWLSAKLYDKLLKWYSNNTPLTSELDAYAHFLPCLGSRMKQSKPSDFSDFRAEMLPLFQDCNFQLLLLSKSKFYHLGTMEEYLIHFNILEIFCRELGIVKNTSNIPKPFILGGERSSEGVGVHKGMVIESYFSDTTPGITVLEDKVQIVIENCHVEVPLQIEGNTIISNCTLKKCPNVRFLHERLSLFRGLLYHTVPVTYQNQSLYVTIAFDVDANMKKTSKNLSEIEVYGTTLSDVICYLGYKAEEVRPSNAATISLWTAKLFVGKPTAAESFWRTHHNVSLVLDKLQGVPKQTECDESNNAVMFSMHDLTLHKNLETLLRDREYLSSLLKG